MPALAKFRAWLPHNKQIIERSHGRNKGIRTGVTGKGDGLRLWTVNQLGLGEEERVYRRGPLVLVKDSNRH